MVNSLTIAKTLSILGHPLLLGNIYVIAMSFHKMPVNQAIWVSSLLLVLVTLPIIIHNQKKVTSGTYSNFDVSDQNQRKSFYPFAIVLFVLLNLAFYQLNLPQEVINHTLIFSGFLILMAVVNLYIKASLHAGIAFYISFSLWDIHWSLGLALFILAIGIAWSRKYTRRHSLPELIIGGLIGALSGLSGLFLIF